MIIHYTGRNHSRSPSNERHTNTTFVSLTFCTSKDSIMTEEIRIGTTFHMRTIIACENNQCILFESLFLQLRQYLTHISIEASHHGCKLSMSMERGVVTRPMRRNPILVFRELFLIILQDTVFRLYQFRMRKRVSEYSKERLFAILAINPLQGCLMNHVCRILGTLLITFSMLRMLDIVFQGNANHFRITFRLTVTIQEIRIV